MQISYQHPNIVNRTKYKALIINANHFTGKDELIKNALKIFTFGKSNNYES
jgi:hypothetical protein